MHKSILRMIKSLTRSAFEKRLGGTFEPVEGAPGRRHNGQWVTYKDASLKVQGRTDCFCRRLIKDGPVFSAHKWTELAKVMGI